MFPWTVDVFSGCWLLVWEAFHVGEFGAVEPPVDGWPEV